MFSKNIRTELSFVGDLTAHQDFEGFSSFDGKEIKVEASSNYPHDWVESLGVYRGNPFVTGSFQPPNTKTEILDYASNQWIMGEDYPWSFGDR